VKGAAADKCQKFIHVILKVGKKIVLFEQFTFGGVCEDRGCNFYFKSLAVIGFNYKKDS
jgi:hypothetical protein